MNLTSIIARLNESIKKKVDKRSRTIAAAAILISYAATSEAWEVDLAWDPPTTNTDGTVLQDLRGYRLYHGRASKSYTTSADVGNVTNKTIPGLSPCTMYFFSVTAYNKAGRESDFSDEFVWEAPPIISPVDMWVSEVTRSNGKMAISVSALEPTDSQSYSNIIGYMFSFRRDGFLPSTKFVPKTGSRVSATFSNLPAEGSYVCDIVVAYNVDSNGVTVARTTKTMGKLSYSASGIEPFSNPFPPLHVTLGEADSPNHFALRWQGEPGREYVVESIDNLLTTNWTRVSTMVPVNSVTLTYTPTDTVARLKFYRITERAVR